MSHRFPLAPFTISRLLTLRASRPSRPFLRTPLIQLHHSLTLAGYGPSRSLPSGSIVEDLQAALTQLKLARCPHSLTASLAALPSMSLIPFTPLIRSRPRGSSVTLTDLTVHLPRAHGSIHRNRSRLEGFGLGKKKWGASKHLTFFTFPNLKRGLYSVVICTSSDLSPVARSTVSKLPTPGA